MADISPNSPTSESDPEFERQLLRYHQLLVCGRWVTAGVWWLVVGLPSLWNLRSPMLLLLDHFTWSGLYYGLYFRPLSAIGISSSIGLIAAILVWHSRNILFGWPPSYQKFLESKVYRIRQQGKSHPLWSWIAHCPNE
ncbi:hypothetical protein [Roseofilum casamattae]|uniref:Uncharacterized protein n=1 Tax=Roseofilum casamattae BLCC-M143 TaxID=3022442 RepID=A0ABT7BY08_9CYAN|nr:hypothetical protein [Roseofilum casamattae]MDJ1184083.1 hypothetical protein [Roseofilum casamattae BLCC-M143]